MADENEMAVRQRWADVGTEILRRRDHEPSNHQRDARLAQMIGEAVANALAQTKAMQPMRPEPMRQPDPAIEQFFADSNARLDQFFADSNARIQELSERLREAVERYASFRFPWQQQQEQEPWMQ